MPPVCLFTPMPRNDPTDTGGLFIGRRPGTAPILYKAPAQAASPGRRRFDNVLAGGLLALEALLCLTLFGPQPLGWFWLGSHVQYWTGYVTAGVSTIMLGTLVSLFITVALAKRVDHAWKLVRRASGHDQQRGALERIFVLTVGITVVVFGFWFFLIHGPGSSVFPGQPN
jgi:hypothetical protein